MNILVINLTRFGDLLQTQPVIHALKAQGHQVGLICLKNFAPATELLDGLDFVAPLPGGMFLADLDADWRKALSGVQSFVGEIQKQFPVQGIVNTTATLSARLLARRLMVGSPNARPIPLWGFGLDEDGFAENGNVWTTFLQGSTVRRLNCPFNIVDMFRMAAACGDTVAVNRLRPPSAAVQQTAQALVHERAAASLAFYRAARADERQLDLPQGGVDQGENILSFGDLPEKIEQNLLRNVSPAGEECAGYVSFQLGASEARRQWPVEYFARLGDLLWTHLRLCPVLLGAPAERPLAEAYAAVARSPFADCVGATDIPHLAAVLCCTRLLVSNDTGTMHLAAGLDIPVLAIFLATAQAWDTGPYRDDCCCLEPAMSCHPCAFESACPYEHACLRTVKPEEVWALVQNRLCQGQWLMEQAAGPVAQGSGARVWLTGRDAYGFAHLQCLSSHGKEDRSVWLELQRHFYRHIIDGMDSSNSAMAVEDFPLPSAELGKNLSTAFREPVHTVLRQAVALLHLLAEQAHMAQQVPGPLPGQRLLATCNRVRSLFEQCAPLCALGHLWTVLLQERGDDLQAILRMTHVLQRALEQWRGYLEMDV